MTDHQPATPAADLDEWSVSRIDLRSPVSAKSWPVARLELEHPVRGRVTDIASAPGGFDAVFLAAGQILDVHPALLAFNVRSASQTAEHALAIQIDIDLEHDDGIYRGTSFGVDLMHCALTAWLQAASRAGVKLADESPRAVRAHQVSALDDHDGLWIFASADEGAASAVTAKFERDGYRVI